MRRTLRTLCLCLLVCACLSAAALAAEPGTLPGWEEWDTANYGSHVMMVCPDKDLGSDEILPYVSKLISENQGSIEADYRQFQMRYWYTRPANTLAGVVDLMANDVGPAVSGMWPCPETFAYVTVSLGKTSAEYCLNVTVDMNGGSDEMTALYAKLKEIGDDAQASSNTASGRLSYINDWLVKNTRYSNSGAPCENEAYGAIVKRRATVEGIYTDAPDWAVAGIEWCVREGCMQPASLSVFGAGDTVSWQELSRVFGLEAAPETGCVLRSDMVLQAIKEA